MTWRVACFCGTTYTTQADTAACPTCGTPTTVEDPQVTAWRRERRELIHSLPYAYACGHGCSMGPKSPAERALLRRREELDALIAEHA